MISQDFWAPRWRTIEPGYLAFVDDLRQEKPGVRSFLEHHTGDGYHAFVAFCSIPITNQGEDIESIVIEIGCSRESGQLRINSDISYSNGYVLAEGPNERRAESDVDDGWVDQCVLDCLAFVRSSKQLLIALLD